MVSTCCNFKYGQAAGSREAWEPSVVPFDRISHRHEAVDDDATFRQPLGEC
jgi:hypothetical protein